MYLRKPNKKSMNQNVKKHFGKQKVIFWNLKKFEQNKKGAPKTKTRRFKTAALCPMLISRRRTSDCAVHWLNIKPGCLWYANHVWRKRSIRSDIDISPWSSSGVQIQAGHALDVCGMRNMQMFECFSPFGDCDKNTTIPLWPVRWTVNGDQFRGWVGTRWAPLSHRLSCHGINDTLKLILKIKTEKQSLLELFGTVSISLNKVYQDPKELSKYQADEATSSSKMQKMLFSETFQVLYLQSSMNIFTQETGSCLNCDTHRGNTSAHTTQSHWGPLLVI